MDGVTAIAKILRMEGVDFIRCVPYQPLLEAAAIAGIRPIIFRQEGTGIHMVDGYSRVTNPTGWCGISCTPWIWTASS
jgi:acetolactate synthase I/II/III large subunit